MTTVVPNLTAEQWFDRWHQLSLCRKEIGGQRQAKHQEAMAAGSYRTAEGERLHRETDALRRKYDIADARVCVAWARYVIAEHNVVPEDVFDVEP